MQMRSSKISTCIHIACIQEKEVITESCNHCRILFM